MRPRVTTSRFLDHLVLSFNGELDLATRDVFLSARELLWRARGVRSVLDLSNVDFLDCTAVRELDLVTRASFPEPVVVCPHGAPLRVLMYTGFTESHVVVPTLLHATSPRYRALGGLRRSTPGQAGA